MRRAILMVAAVALLLGGASQARADYVFVGSWDLATVGGGYGNPANPYIWTNNPPVYSGVEAAAALFGGSPSDYAISTVDSNPADINHLAFVDGWGDDKFLLHPTSETFSLGVHYNDHPGFDSAFSALVVDHAPSLGHFINYAFRLESPAVPEPASLTLLGLGAVGLAGYGWRRRKAIVA